jgi:hypothetical protein
MRARSTAGGGGKIQWKTADQQEFPAEGQSVAFSLAEGDRWQDVHVHLPVQGTVGIVRIYLPAALSRVEIETLQFSIPEHTQPIRSWDFGIGPH